MAAYSAKISKKARKVGKNRKKGWKLADIRDVEDHLDDQRLNERTGGSNQDKPDESLFFVDTVKRTTRYDASIKGQVDKLLQKTRNKYVLANLNCYKNLLPDTTVDVPTTPRFKKTPKQVKIKPKKVTKKARAAVQKQDEKKPFSFDLWDTPTDIGKAEPILDPELEDYQKEQIKEKRIKAPNHLALKPSCLPSIEAPDPGTSYNPTYRAHQRLLAKATRVEVIKKKLEKKWAKGAGKTIDKGVYETQRMKELMQGLTDIQTVEMNGPIDSTPLSLNPAIKDDDRKTKQKKRKAKRVESAEAKRIRLKEENCRNNDVYRIKSLLKEIKQEDEKSIRRQQRRIATKLRREFQPIKHGKHRFEPADIPVNLTNELAGTLRSIKVEGSLLEDRYKSLQKRNIIETRIRQPKLRKSKQKKFTKDDFKDAMRKEGIEIA